MIEKMRKIGIVALAWMVAFTAVVFVNSIDAEATGNGSVDVATSDDQVIIGNEYISRTFSVAEGKLSTSAITNKRTQPEETIFNPAQGSEEFVVQMTASERVAINRDKWTAKADSYQHEQSETEGNAENLIDGKLTSIWHSNYGAGKGPQEFPYNVVFQSA